VRRTATLILGGGPAGAAAAITLAHGGARPLLVERSRGEIDPLCGGFLSWRTLDRLAALGIDSRDLHQRAVTNVRVFAGDRLVEAPLPRPGLGVSRQTLDAKLIARARQVGAAVEQGVLVKEAEGTSARLRDGSLLSATHLLLATGKHELRGMARPASARHVDPAVGLRIRLPASSTLHRMVGSSVELHLLDRGYAGVVVQEDGATNICLAVRRSRLAEAGSPEALLAQWSEEAPRLGERLAWQDAGGAIQAVANVPYGWRASGTDAGVYRLGDQAAVIPSLAGEGIGIALATGASAARAILAGEAAVAWQRRTARLTRVPVTIASILWLLTERPWLARTFVLAASWSPSRIADLARLTRIRMLNVDAPRMSPHI
jgi:flavin-dependent dehydrogenase